MKATPLQKYAICLFVLLSASQAMAVDLSADHKPPPSYQMNQMNDEEEEELRTIRYTYGLNMGAYFAHDGTANYYNGSGHHSLESAINRQQNYNRIRESLGYDFSLHALPGDMGYSPAMMIGVFGTIFIGQRTAVHGEFNYARLEAEDAFSLELDRPSFIEGDNVYLFPLRGSEERSEVRLGLQHTAEVTGSSVHPFFEGGMSFVNTRVRENTARIEGRSYSIRNIGDTYYDFRDDGIGYGGYATIGLRMDLGDVYAMALGANGSFINLNLGDNDAFYLNYSIFARIFLSQ